MKRIAVLLLAMALNGCLDSRERLSPPRLYLRIDPAGVPSGAQMVGRASAADPSGIVYISVDLAIDGDTRNPLHSYASGFEQDTVDYDFQFTVRTGFPSGTKLFVTATARDDQNFEIIVRDTTFIR